MYIGRVGTTRTFPFLPSSPTAGLRLIDVIITREWSVDGWMDGWILGIGIDRYVCTYM